MVSAFSNLRLTSEPIMTNGTRMTVTISEVMNLAAIAAPEAIVEYENKSG